jgi:crotonobetainyl-CoA:carnitine CoA-transferase CaiB-like acyl-CoA transferase
VPDVGEHGAEIARALGYSEAELAAMQADRVL